jgi:hypothetical protein
VSPYDGKWNGNGSVQPDVILVGETLGEIGIGKINMDRGGCGLVAGRNFSHDGENPSGAR